MSFSDNDAYPSGSAAVLDPSALAANVILTDFLPGGLDKDAPPLAAVNKILRRAAEIPSTITPPQSLADRTIARCLARQMAGSASV